MTDVCICRQLKGTINLNVDVDATDESISLSQKYLQKAPLPYLFSFSIYFNINTISMLV